MPVWYVYRSFDVAPTGKHTRCFKDGTILKWFQRNWEFLAVEDRDLADRRLIELVGYGGWPLFMPFIHSAEAGLPVPNSIEEVVARLRAGLDDETENVISDSPHVVQIMTEDDGEGGAVYVFDGHFLKRSGHLAAYLLPVDWRLPTGNSSGGFTPTAETRALYPTGDGPGATYAVFLVRESKYPIDDLMPAWRIDGVRLPGLLGHLLAAPPDDDFAGYLRLLPVLGFAGVEMDDPVEEAFLSGIRADPTDSRNWDAWNSWRFDRGGEPPGIRMLRDAFERMARLPGSIQDKLDRKLSPSKLLAIESKHGSKLRKDPKSLIHVEEHLAQMCLDVSHNDEAGSYFGQWILFDDQWANANLDLANALLCWCARWDVLSIE